MPSEPMTLITDLVLALWAFVLGGRLLAGRSYLPRSFWGAGFFFTGSAALLGGLWHGYSPAWGDVAATLVWKFVLAMIGAADALFALAVVRHALLGKWRQRMMWVVVLKAVIFFFLILWTDEFWVAVLDYLPTLLLIAILAGMKRSGAPGANWLLSGTGLALFAALIQVSGVDIHRWFNHNDLYHLVQGGALYAFYRAGRQYLVPRSCLLS